MNGKFLTSNRNQFWAYSGLVFVIFVWGTVPLTSKYFLDYYSPSFGVAWTSMVSFVALATILRKKFKNITRDYFKVAVPLGIFYTVAIVSQKIGLQYTTPAVCAFFENLSCVVVPFLMWWFIKKKPAILQIVGSIVCLLSMFVLSGLGAPDKGISIGVGEILCAFAGILYGVNMAGAGAFTKEFDSALYIMVLTAVQSVLSLIIAVAFNFIIVNGAPIETIRFSWNPVLLLSRIAIVLVSSTLCWIIRTNSMKYVNTTVIAVMMPFSAVIAGILSVIVGMDELTTNLVLGASLGLAAMLICVLGDVVSDRKTKEKDDKTAIITP